MEKPNPLAAQGSNEEDEDTLSLSNLPMYCDQNIEFWVEDQSSGSDIEQDFEFSSEMMITSHHDSSKPIVFCGKIIHISPHNIQKLESKKQLKSRKNHEANYVRNVFVSDSKTKSRWYLFVIGFGSSRVSKEMHIRDLRKRQLSVRNKCGEYSNFDECDGNGMRSRGFMRFLGCGGGCTRTVDDDETL